jgi:phosphoglycolate phosphatase-like HAD superfamily hydrolase
MKPNPCALNAAMSAVQIGPTSSVFVGDSVTDIQAAHSVNVRCVGYANKPTKVAIFVAESADSVITKMATFADAVRISTPIS